MTFSKGNMTVSLGRRPMGSARIAALMLLGLSLLMPAAAMAQTSLRIFTGGLLRPDLFRQIGEAYARSNPGITVEVETGGATPELQQRALAAAIASKDATLDLVLIDVLRPSQWVAGQVIEPLDAYLGADRDATVARYLAPYRATMSVGGKVVALPISADVQMLYYRKDLLEKHGLSVPKTWDELKTSAQKVLDAEKTPALRGFEMSGAPVEATVCSYLTGVWGAGEEMVKSGKLALDGEGAKKPFQLWSEMKAAKLLATSPAEVSTDRVRQDLQAGTLLFGSAWAYAFPRLQGDAGTLVKDKIGLARLPGFSPEHQAGCIGGWQVAVTAFSKNKLEAVKFARFLSSPERAKLFALQVGWLPVFEPLYADEEVLKAQPWFRDALPALQSGKLRPATPRYSEVSEIIRTNVSAFLSGNKNADAALTDMTKRLGVIFK